MIEAAANGGAAQPVLVLKDEAGNYYFEEAIADAWRLNGHRPDVIVERGIRFLPVAGFKGAEVSFDARHQRLVLNIPSRYLKEQVRVIRKNTSTAAVSGLGAYMDYDFSYGEEADGEANLFTGFLQPNLFSPVGVFGNTLIYRHGDVDDGDNADPYDRFDETNGLIRLESTWTTDDPEHMRSYRAGDAVLYPGMLGIAARFGGVQIASNFSTQPSLVTFPLPNLGGEALLRSDANVFVNGRLTYRDELDPGPFSFNEIPVVTGGGEIRVVTRDLLGREQVIVSDFYASQRLLRPGLSEYAYSAGALRENYGIDSNNYGEGFLAGFHRYGLNDALTVEGQFETTEDFHRVGGGATWSLPRIGATSSGLSISQDNGSDQDASTGLLAYLSHEYNTTRWGLNGTVRWASDEFRQLGMYEDASRLRLQTSASGSLSLVPWGSIGAAISHTSFHDERDRNLYSVRYSGRLRNFISVSAYASYIENSIEDEQDDDYAIGLNFTMSLGVRRSATMSVYRSGDETRVGVQTRRDLPVGPGVGYRFGAAMDESDTDWDADVVAQNRVGRVGIQTAYRENGLSWRSSASGSVAWLGGMPFATREIRDAFAVVKVNGFENVRVYLENQEVAKTDSSGRALIPGLRPYQENRIRIATEDLPLNARIDALEIPVAPYFRSGVLADFPAAEGNDVFMQVRLADGRPAPEGAVVRVQGLKERFPVGLDGSLYLTGVKENVEASLFWRDGRCTLSLQVPRAEDLVPDIGIVTCE